ncbi:MAG: hypothetical protein NXI31_14120 [bacterium]|nr:hypothetical protein [bacterium]
MSHPFRIVALGAAASVVFFVVGCQGDGSDIGPRFEPLPDTSSKVNVYDDDNAGVAGARVTILGTGVATLTGRNGRGDLFARPAGRHLIRVEGGLAAASPGDRLGDFTAAMELVGDDLPVVFHLPNSGVGFAQTIPVGTLTGPVNLGNPFGLGGSLFFTNGSSVGATGGASTVQVETGMLKAEHLPGELPDGVLMGAALWVAPMDLTVSPGADLSVGYDLGVNGTVALYHLDPLTGAWTQMANGTAGAGVINAAAGVTSGGLWAFGTPVTTGSVRGRVVDAFSDPVIPVRDALVNVDGRWGRTEEDGTFVVSGVPATLGDNTTARSATVEFYAGGDWLPVIATTSVMMNGTFEVDVGDTTLDTLPANNMRIQQVKRARAESFRPARVSSLFGNVARATMSDADGRATLEDVPALWFGFQDAFPRDRVFAFYAQATGFSANGQRWLDAFQFYDEFAWFAGSRSSRVLITDAMGGGPLFLAGLVRGATVDSGFAGESREAGVLFSERAFDRRATASHRSERPGRVVVHAMSIDTPDGEKLEMPLQQALRTPLGQFDRHGLFAGTITGASGTATHELRATRRIALQEWWDAVAKGFPIPSALPIDTDPAMTHGDYRAGVDRSGGHIVVAELDTSAGRRLDKLAVAPELEPIEGGLTSLDIPMDHIANTTFTAPGVLTNLDATLAGFLAVDVALANSRNLAIDVVRGLDGNHSGDLSLLLPALDGDLAAWRWVTFVSATAAVAGGTKSQNALVEFDRNGPIQPPVMLPAPTITAPLDGGVVSASQFTVEFTLPPGTLYGHIELRSDNTAELLLWEAFVPPGTTSFEFVKLPDEVQNPLVTAKNYSLKVTAFGSTSGGGILATLENPYRSVTTFLQSIGEIERDVDTFSSFSIDVTSL